MNQASLVRVLWMCHVVNGSCTCERENQDARVEKLDLFPDLLRNLLTLSPVWVGWAVAPIPPRNLLTPKLRVGGDTCSHRVDMHPMASHGQGSDVLSWIPVPQLP